MVDLDLPRVQELAREIRASAVNPVSRDGVAEVFEVDADLVGAAGFRAAFQEGQFPFRGKHPPLGLGST